ncbi:MAG: hypothetical protein M1829_002853 [Trizodia sp. TS-e1964]|nr:MAG: hypothetical protein M1829_002853 [Trizodia sp. TS-e1964]
MDPQGGPMDPKPAWPIEAPVKKPEEELDQGQIVVGHHRHQRHQSAGALSSFTSTMGLKAPGRKIPFAERPNTSKPLAHGGEKPLASTAESDESIDHNPHDIALPIISRRAMRSSSVSIVDATKSGAPIIAGRTFNGEPIAKIQPLSTYQKFSELSSDYKLPTGKSLVVYEDTHLPPKVQETDAQAPMTDTEAPEANAKAQEADAMVQEEVFKAEEADVKVQEEDVRAQETDIKDPNTDEEAPATDVNIPVIVVISPAIDANTPEVDASIPEIEANTLEIDAGTLEIDANSSAIATNTPEIDIGTPETDVASDSLETASDLEEFHEAAEHPLAEITTNADPIKTKSKDEPFKATLTDLHDYCTELVLYSGGTASPEPSGESIKNSQEDDAEDPVFVEVEHYQEARSNIRGHPSIFQTSRFSVSTERIVKTILPAGEHECWEEDQDDETYDEELAHYRGENSTYGQTMILIPYADGIAHEELDYAKQVVQSSRSPEEIEDERLDSSMVAEYADDIFDHLKELEVSVTTLVSDILAIHANQMLQLKMLPNPHYMDNQTEIQWSMRSVLIEWCIQVHYRFVLLPETLFLCVNFIDRFLSSKVVSLAKLQLVGATALFLAAKYEEINCPTLHEIVYMVDRVYTRDEIIKAERFMLNILDFELGWPGPMSFLRRISKADDYDLETRTVAKYLLEVTLMDERFVGTPPSFVAAGSHCLARLLLRKGDWSASHVHYSGLTYTQLYPLLRVLMQCLEHPRDHHGALFEKYTERKFKRASLFVQAEMENDFIIPAAYSLIQDAPNNMLAIFNSN